MAELPGSLPTSPPRSPVYMTSPRSSSFSLNSIPEQQPYQNVAPLAVRRKAVVRKAPAGPASPPLQQQQQQQQQHQHQHQHQQQQQQQQPQPQPQFQQHLHLHQQQQQQQPSQSPHELQQQQHEPKSTGLKRGFTAARALYGRPPLQGLGPLPQISPLSFTNTTPSAVGASSQPRKPATSTCAHCKRGIEFFTTYSSCLFCRVDICTPCIKAFKHPGSHNPVLVNFRDLPTIPTATRSAKPCQQCTNQFHCRIDCIDCPDYSICDACFDAQQGIRAVAHEHSNFCRIREPNRSVFLDTDGFRPSTTVGFGEAGGIWSYCASCSRGIGISEPAIMCKHCFVNFDHTRSVCEGCRTTACFAHVTVDSIISLQLCPISDEAQSVMTAPFGCSHCTASFNSLKEVCSTGHEHTNFILSVTDAILESMIHQGFRLCPSKETKMIDLPTLTQEDVLCSRCLNTFHQGSCKFCLDCKTSVFCPECFPHAVEYHHCVQAGFVCPEDVTIATLGLKQPFAAKRTADNLIWYEMKASGMWTFTPPSTLTGRLVAAINIPPDSPWYYSPLEDETPCWRNRDTGVMTLRHPGNNGSTGLPIGWDFNYTRNGRVLFTNRDTGVSTYSYPDGPRAAPAVVQSPTSPRAAAPPYHRNSSDTASVSSQSSATLVTPSSEDPYAHLAWEANSGPRARRGSRQLVNSFPTIDSKYTASAWKGVKKAGKSRTAWGLIGTGVSLSINLAGMAVGQDLSAVGRAAGSAVKGIGGVVVTQAEKQERMAAAAAAQAVVLAQAGSVGVSMDPDQQGDMGAASPDPSGTVSPDAGFVDPMFMPPPPPPPPIDMSDAFAGPVEDAASDPIDFGC